MPDVGWLFDLWGFNRLTVKDLSAGVDAGHGRWALLWLLGFFGTAIMVFLGSPGFFFGFFAVMKVLFEVLSRLERRFGWGSLKDSANEVKA